MKNIKYIGYYCDNNFENRFCSPAAVNKMNYICDALIRNGYDVEIISPSWTNNKHGYYKKALKKANKKSIRYFASFGSNNKLLKFIKRKYSLFQLKKYLLKNIHENETILIYHSCSFYNIIKCIKKTRNVKIILEVEEIYGNVIKNYQSKNEYKIFDLADEFIFITDLLQNEINKDNKRYCITHGTYKIEKIITKKSDKKIHILYSGIIDKLKKGAFMACELANHLDDTYIVHIIGFGRDEDIADLINVIKKYNKKNKCKIVFDGLKIGKEFIEYIQKCDIGLSTQDPNAKYNDTSFPSKILTYLSNNLRVVTIDIPAISTSNVSQILYYYKDNNPKDISDTIKKINLNDNYDSRKILRELDNKFTKEILRLIEDDK